MVREAPNSKPFYLWYPESLQKRGPLMPFISLTRLRIRSWRVRTQTPLPRKRAAIGQTACNVPSLTAVRYLTECA
jgi:hypothetical protein